MQVQDTVVVSRLWRFWAQVVLDVFLAVMATVFAVGLYNEVLAGDNPTGLGLTVLMVHGGSLLARRRWPAAVITVMLATAAFYTLVLHFPAYLVGPGILVATYTAGSVSTSRPVW